MARPMPVLPDEGSMRIWSGWPGLRMPSLSAISIIDSATRSLTDPPGVCPSTPRNSPAPIRPRPDSAPGHGRQDRDLGAIGDGRVQALQVPHVIVVHVDVDELVQRPVVLHHLARQTWLLGQTLGQHVPQGGPGELDAGRPTGVGTQDGRQTDFDGHWASSWVITAGPSAGRVIVD